MEIPENPEPTFENARKLLEAGRNTLLLAMAEANYERRSKAVGHSVMENAAALDRLLLSLHGF